MVFHCSQSLSDILKLIPTPAPAADFLCRLQACSPGFDRILDSHADSCYKVVNNFKSMEEHKKNIEPMDGAK
jgi:hypothetical protein